MVGRPHPTFILRRLIIIGHQMPAQTQAEACGYESSIQLR